MTQSRPSFGQIATIAVMLGLAALAFATTFDALVWVGELSGHGVTAARRVPWLIEGTTLVAALAWVQARRRGERGLEWMWTVGGSVLLSGIVQLANALVHGAQFGLTPAQVALVERVVAVVMAPVPSVLLLIALHAAFELMLGRAPARRPARSRARSVVTTTPDASAKPRATAPAAPTTADPAATTTQARAPRKAGPSRSALTAEQVAEVARLTADGLGQRAIAEQVGSTKSSVARAQAALRAENGDEPRPALHAV